MLAASTAPAYALSCTPVIKVLAPALDAGTSVDNSGKLTIRDSKNANSNTNTDPLSNVTGGVTNPVVNMTIEVRACGEVVPGVTLVVSGDQVKDSENNYMIGFSPASQTSGFGESPTQRIATVTTGVAGTAVVKISTATYNGSDKPFIPRSGTWTVTASYSGGSAITNTYDYTVIDGVALV